MAKDDKRAGKAKRGGRSTVVAGLLAIVALVAVWLSDCIPGFGIGSGVKDGEGEPAEETEPAKPAEPEPEPAAEPDEQPVERKPMPMKLTVDVRGCMIDGGEPIDCKTLCDDPKRFEGIDSVIIDAKDGPYQSV